MDANECTGLSGHTGRNCCLALAVEHQNRFVIAALGQPADQPCAAAQVQSQAGAGQQPGMIKVVNVATGGVQRLEELYFGGIYWDVDTCAEGISGPPMVHTGHGRAQIR